MKHLILAVFLFFGPKDSFISKDSNYQISLDENRIYETRVIRNGFADIFTIIDENNKFKYMLTISKITLDKKVTYEDINSELFKKNFALKCDCIIEGSEKIKYKNFTALKYNIIVDNGKMFMKGEALNIPFNKSIYSVNYMANKETVEMYRNEFHESLNTLQLLK